MTFKHLVSFLRWVVLSPNSFTFFFTCLTMQSMLVFFNPIKFGFTFTLGNLMALGRSVLDFFFLV